MSSLLASLYSRIRGSQEDVATLSLTYILKSSTNASNAFVSLLTRTIGLLDSYHYQFINQATGLDKDRPDIAVHHNGREVALVEAKFYAGLTDNQPNTYVQRLIDNQGHGLLFICPSIRMSILFQELLARLNRFNVTDVQHANFSCTVEGVKVCVIDWRTVTNTIELGCANDTSVLADLHQLKGLCERMDIDNPLPFTSSELDKSRARELIKLYSLPVRVFDDLKKYNDLEVDGSRMKTTPREAGISKYFILNGWGCDITVDFNSWLDMNKTATPLWLTIKNMQIGDWSKPSPEVLHRLLLMNTQDSKTVYDDESGIWIALNIPTSSEIDIVVQQLSLQVHDAIVHLPKIRIELYQALVAKLLREYDKQGRLQVISTSTEKKEILRFITSNSTSLFESSDSIFSPWNISNRFVYEILFTSEAIQVVGIIRKDSTTIELSQQLEQYARVNRLPIHVVPIYKDTKTVFRTIDLLNIFDNTDNVLSLIETRLSQIIFQLIPTYESEVSIFLKKRDFFLSI